MSRAWTLALLVLLGCERAAKPSRAPASSARPSSPATSQRLPLPAGAEAAAQAITADFLRGIVAELSHDRFAGRAPGTPGDEAARRWLVEQLQSMGYAPGGPDGGWQQPFPIVRLDAHMPATWTFVPASGAASDPLALRWSADYIAASGVQRERVEVDDAELVFVGHGIHAPEQDWNDFEGADLAGKILLVLNDDPDAPPDRFGGERRLYYGRWTYKWEEAGRQGAAGAIIVHTPSSAGYPWSVVQSSWSGPQFELPAGDEPRAPIHAWVTEDAAERLVALGGHQLAALAHAARSPDFEPVPLGVRTSFAFSTSLQRTQTANVIGRLPGAHPERARQAVVVTAHHDHLGVGEPDEHGDRIYNGARDNASGVAQALGVAKAFAALPQPPDRSVLVLLVGAEEQGLLGAKYFARHPTIPSEHLAANLNFELGNLWGPTRDVVIHGFGKTTLDPWVRAAAARQRRRVEDEADPRAGWYYRSDQFAFARIGVPAIWLESGRDYEGRPAGWGDRVIEAWIAEHYHQPSDELRAEWDFEGMVEDARLGFWVAAAVATAEGMPGWTEGDEFASKASTP